MSLLENFKFQERFAEDDFVKFISIKDYNTQYSPKVEIPHTHNYYLIMLISEGNGKHFIDFNGYPLHKNALYFMSPGQVHHLDRSIDTDGYDLIFEEFYFCSGTSKNEIILPPPFFSTGLFKPYLNLEDENAEYIKSLFDRVNSELKKNDIAKWEVIRSIINILINKIYTISDIQTKVEISKVKQAYKINNDFRFLVEQYFLKEKNISFYANKLNITTNHLSETTKEVSGITPTESIRKRTLLEAKRLLLENILSVKEISFHLGYENPSYFIKLFKEETNFTPTKFRIMTNKI